eukprot:622211-Amphidinium_carterae.3
MPHTLVTLGDCSSTVVESSPHVGTSVQCKWAMAAQGHRRQNRQWLLSLLLAAACLSNIAQCFVTLVSRPVISEVCQRLQHSSRGAKMQRKRSRAPVLTRTTVQQTDVDVTPKTQTREREVDVKPAQ